MKVASYLAVVLGVCLSSIGFAADYGNISGTFIYDGAAPKPEPLNVTKDLATCGKLGLVDESLVVNPNNNGLKNVVVYMYIARDAKAPAAPGVKAKELVLDNDGCRFEPHLLAMSTTDTLILSNSDPIGHNSKIDFFNNTPQNPSLAAGAKLSLAGKINVGESLPSPVSCGIHPWMNAWVLVQDHPFFAVSDANGEFTIENVPVGTWKFRVWQEKAGYILDVGAGKTDPRYRTIELTVKEGDNKLGDIKVPANLFEK